MYIVGGGEREREREREGTPSASDAVRQQKPSKGRRGGGESCKPSVVREPVGALWGWRVLWGRVLRQSSFQKGNGALMWMHREVDCFNFSRRLFGGSNQTGQRTTARVEVVFEGCVVQWVFFSDVACIQRGLSYDIIWVVIYLTTASWGIEQGKGGREGLGAKGCCDARIPAKYSFASQRTLCCLLSTVL